MASYFLLTFTSLFTLVNPLGVIPIFLSYIEGTDKRDTLKIAFIASFAAFVCLLFFALSGPFVFKLFNISVDGLRVVGGVLFFINGYDMLQAKVGRTKIHKHSDAAAMGKAAAITPLAIPMISGPGSIAATIVHMREAPDAAHQFLVIGVLVLVCVLTFVILLGGKQITRVLGESGNKVFMRLMGLILMMIAVEFFFSGITPYVQRMVGS